MCMYVCMYVCIYVYIYCNHPCVDHPYFVPRASGQALRPPPTITTRTYTIYIYMLKYILHILYAMVACVWAKLR